MSFSTVNRWWSATVFPTFRRIHGSHIQSICATQESFPIIATHSRTSRTYRSNPPEAGNVACPANRTLPPLYEFRTRTGGKRAESV